MKENLRFSLPVGRQVSGLSFPFIVSSSRGTRETHDFGQLFYG